MVVIPDARKIKRLEENVEPVKVNFSSEGLSEIKQIINSIEIVDDIYMKNNVAIYINDLMFECRVKFRLLRIVKNNFQ
ncbi:hypothetical protein RhiirC2_855078 [Rhizophagus irregularis]|uniref:Uncharacterized protein n=1 Tax=Rhizophagus irregularis TaxID=588596 RepID=A0A2N1MNZ2_9GLOM|nr:hypothetical protein RhiirC2_855078 [Rhizophagus irregularis]